jgi:hypothetical protein
LQDFAENCRLSRKQEQAIIELLDPSNKALVETAQKVGIAERTLRYWLKLPHFQEQLEHERQRLRDKAFSKLRNTLTMAVERLEELLDDANSNVKLKACQTVLDFNLKVIEIEELEKRLEKLEASNK